MSLLGRGRPLCCLARLQSRNANSDGTYGAAVHPSRFFSTWEEQEGGPLSNASGAVASKPLVQVTQSLKGHKIELQVLGRTAADYALQCAKRSSSPEEESAQGSIKERLRCLLKNTWLQVTSTFMPADYPGSVGPGYLAYSRWQAVTNFAVTANSVLASTFLLYSVGLGAGAIPTAGALNWVLKDGLGQAGTLLFGKQIAHNFDIYSKTWFVLANAALAMATGLEIATVLAPQHFLTMGSIANMAKGLSWMASGSTRSVFNLSFQRDNNIADITAKAVSQYIAASIAGTAAGVSIAAVAGTSVAAGGTAFVCLAGIALYGSLKTVRTIPLSTLNNVRLQMLAEKYIACASEVSAADRDGSAVHRPPHAGAPHAHRHHHPHPLSAYINYQKEYAALDDSDVVCDLALPSPTELAPHDPILAWLAGDQRFINPVIHVGSSLKSVVGDDSALLVVVLNAFKYSRYMLIPVGNAIHVVLHDDVSARDMVQAYLQACILRRRLRIGMHLGPGNLPELRFVLHDTLLAAEKLTAGFLRALNRRGWQTQKVVVEAVRRRAVWGDGRRERPPPPSPLEDD